ncbi:hypothetical protein [Plantibacter sp. ME-Dv--P-122b]|uniref:hypothetical protein n=1 Tax=Plantibacter sp. ME-Dv--P-122b TaxID=3040300 RepID=UPI00254A9B83|nr:hypothetical protein [Plantibacter sp. ME-Dv--P-122b]
MVRRRPLPLELSKQPFSMADADELGVPRSRLRARDLATPHRGVRAPLDQPTDVPGRCRAYAPLLHDGQFFSHVSAAALHGLPVPTWEHEAPLDVASIAPARAPRGAGVRGHQLDGDHWEVVVVEGLPVLTAVDAWCQLGTRLPLDDLVIAGDVLLRRKRPLASEQQIVRGLARMNGRRGAKRLRLAFSMMRPRTDSPMETALRLLIVRAGLPEPLVNEVISDTHGRFLALGDLVYPEQRVLVEYDGGTHFADERQIFHDIDRLDRVMAAGWRVIRVNRSHLTDPSPILTALARELSLPASRGAPD